MTPDIIIIGSGFGGAFAAHQLTAAGLHVVVVERGPWRDTQPLQQAGIAERSPLPYGRHAATHLVRQIATSTGSLQLHRHGLFDLHLERDMTVACSSSVGGGSHVYAAMNTRPANTALWENCAPDVSAKSMSPHYDTALALMGARQPSEDLNIPNFTGVRFDNHPQLKASPPEDQPAMGFRFEQGNFRSNSFLGSPDGSKVTLDELLLVPALNKGLQVLDLYEAVDIGRSARGWRVSLRDHRTGHYRHLSAPRLLLAAGTLNTLRLLFAARARGSLGGMPALGRGFGGNGDVIGYWACGDKDADYSAGPPCHGRFVVPGMSPDIMLTSLGINGIDDLPLPRALRHRLKQDVLLVAMGTDAANGTARWENGRLRLHYNAAANPVLSRIAGTLDHLSRLTRRPVYFPRQLPVTVHPLGGARVDENPSSGVIDGQGEVHGHAGLHIADGSALPGAPGTPPSMSIAAWALHVSHQIAARG